MRSEADVKKRVKQVLKELGAWYFMPVPVGYGVYGIPDFIVCHQGRFIAIETKFGSNKPTRWQQIQLQEIRRHWGLALLINEENVDQLAEMIRS